MSESPDEIRKLRKEDYGLYASIREKAWVELEKRLTEDPGAIKDIQLMRLVIETAKLDLGKESKPEPAAKTQNNYRTLMISAQALPPEKRLEIEAAIRGEMRELQEALDVLPEGEEDGE